MFKLSNILRNSKPNNGLVLISYLVEQEDLKGKFIQSKYMVDDDHYLIVQSDSFKDKFILVKIKNNKIVGKAVKKNYDGSMKENHKRIISNISEIYSSHFGDKFKQKKKNKNRL